MKLERDFGRLRENGSKMKKKKVPSWLDSGLHTVNWYGQFIVILVFLPNHHVVYHGSSHHGDGLPWSINSSLVGFLLSCHLVPHHPHWEQKRLTQLNGT